MNRADLFQAIRPFAPEGRYTAAHVAAIDALADSFGLATVSAPAATGGKTINAKGLALIKEFEGLRLKAYPDPATGGDPVTIGYGRAHGVRMGQAITEPEAETFLKEDLARFESAVRRLAPISTDNQFSALVSFAFNLGEGNLASSTLLKKHNAGDYTGAAKEFIRWNKANGKVMNGLTRRREAEAALYSVP